MDAKEVRKRLEAARAWKSQIEADLVEGYFFTAPRRARFVRSNQKVLPNKSEAAADAAELHTTLGIECADDFVGMIVEAFMPPNFDWARRVQGMLSKADWAQISRQADQDDKIIMASIRGSNLYAVLKSALFPDLSLAGAGLWVEDAGVASPPEVRAVPIREMDVEPGPGGTVGARFVTQWHVNRDLAGVLPLGAIDRLPAGEKQKIAMKPDGQAEVVWALIPDTSVPLTERWTYVIQVNKFNCHEETLTGEGSCPLLVMRFDVDPSSPWADGPTLKALPYLRVMDAYAQMSQDNAEFQADPSFIYPSDNVLNFEGGLLTGMAYPSAAGFDRNQMFWLRPDARPDLMLLTADQIRQEVRRLHYADFPEQRGKTPPTASQWIDEMVKMQKRIGLSGETFWREGPRAIFMRFKYLLEKRGVIQKLKVGGREVPLEPYNPAIKGQEFQEVQMAERLLSLTLAYGGVQGQAAVDVMGTLTEIQKKLGDGLVKWNDPQAMQQLLAQLVPQTDLNIGNTGTG